ncbi:MAG TPA: hypothetical protein VK986_27225 [Tepidisphaeraceae bacterium]|nr:hypothetical protein [Tepidisphaeraceae bacterium]
MGTCEKRGLVRGRKPGRLGAVIALAGLAGLAAPVSAAVLVNEGFGDYNTDATGAPTTDANLNANNGGTGFSTAWSAGLATPPNVVAPTTPLSYAVTNSLAQNVGTVGGGSRALQFLNTTTADGTIVASRSFATSSNANEVWGRFLVRVDSGQVDNSDFLTLYFGNSTANPNFNIIGGSTGDFSARNGGGGQVSSPTEVGAGNIGVTTYLLVARIVKATPGAASNFTSIDLWVNPVLDAGNNLTFPYVSAALSPGVTSIGSLGIRHANLDAGDTFLMDEIVFGTAVGDVVPGAVGLNVPEPSSVLLAAAALPLLARRRRWREVR